jgi:hypothetical protein
MPPCRATSAECASLSAGIGDSGVAETHASSDAINAMLAAVGYNFRRLIQ